MKELIVILAACGFGFNTYADWTLLWSDEFNGNSLNTNTWAMANCGGWGSGQLMYYTNDTLHSTVSNGYLAIKATATSLGGGNYYIASSRMVSIGFDQCVATLFDEASPVAPSIGALEFRARIPVGTGLWPAIWLLSYPDGGGDQNWNQPIYGPWPGSGEIDIVETSGRNNGGFDSNVIDDNGSHNIWNPVADVTQWHVYRLNWLTNQLQFVVDGITNGTFSNWTPPTGFSYPAPFDVPFVITMNLAVGGDYVGNPTPAQCAAALPAELDVDYVRVYAEAAPPVANSQQVAVIENTSTNIILTGSDPQNLPLSYVVTSGPSNGVLNGVAPYLNYAPSSNYFGADSFMFKVNDGNLDSSIAMVSINVMLAGPVDPVVTWTNLDDVVYGTALNAQQLNAAANVPGTFVYSPPTGAVLGAGSNQVLSVRFTPIDTNGYNTVARTVNLNVSQAALTISASNQTKVYGAALPSLTAGYVGFVNGDTSSNLATQASLTTAATVGSSVATYPIFVGEASGPNYVISFVDGTLAVTPALLTITANNQIKAFGAALPVLTATFSGFVNGDSSLSLLTPVVLTTTATTTSAEGTYSITASGASSSNYTIAFVDGTMTVLAHNILSFQTTTNNQFRLTSVGPPNQVCIVQYTTNLTTTWVSVGNVTSDFSGNFSFGVSATSGAGFFRSVFP